MKLPHRRQFLHLAAGAAALPAVSRVAWAQAYPTRPVVPFAPASSTDIVARLIGQWLSERLGQQFVIDNRPGGGSNIGTEAAVRASPQSQHGIPAGAREQQVVHPGEVLVEVRAGGVIPTVNAVGVMRRGRPRFCVPGVSPPVF